MSDPSSDSVNISDGQFADQVENLSRRLTRHLDHVDAGELDAVEDVAAVLRTLLCHGVGDRVLLRACKRFQIELPDFIVSDPPNNDRSTIYSLGTLLNPPDAENTEFDTNHHRINLNNWIDRPAVVVRGARRRSNTWNQVISAYANTTGAHLSNAIPALLNETRVIQASGLSLGDFLIRSAGVVAEIALSYVLPGVGRVQSKPPRSHVVRDMALTGLTISDPNNEPTVSVSFQGSPTKSEALVTVPLDGQWISTLYSPDGEGTYKLEVIFQDAPPTWLRPAE